MKVQITDLLEKEMDRKQFLQVVGAGAVAVFGLGTLSGLLLPRVRNSGVQSLGYGSSIYGGTQKKAID